MTDGDLYDLLQRLFGVGTWDEDTCSEPWWKARALEISKIKRSRTSRRVDLDDLALAAEYCKAHRLPVQNVAWLYRHIGDALRWRAEHRRQQARLDFALVLAEAIEQARDAGEDEWADRLVRARGPHAREVYDQWLHRSSNSRSSQVEHRPA